MTDEIVPRRLQAMTFEQYQELGRQSPRSYLWDGIFPLIGSTLFTADAFVGKTTLVAELAAAMSVQGGSMVGRAVTPGSMLYIKTEHFDGDVADLFKKAAHGVGLERSNVYFLKLSPPSTLDDSQCIEEVIAIADEIDAAAIVIDPLRRASGLDENNTQDVGEWGRTVQRLVGDNERSVIVVHHLNKNQSVRGSTDLLAQVDSQVRLSKSGGGLVLFAQPHNGPEVTLHLRQEWGDGWVRPVATGQTTAGVRIEVWNAIGQVCLTTPRTTRELRAEVAKIVRADHTEIDKTRDEMAKQGVIRNASGSKRHQWVVVPPNGQERSSHIAPMQPEREIESTAC